MTDTPLVRTERPARGGSPAGVLVLLHGRGADGNDLFPLIEMLDPERRLHCATLQAPMRLPGQPGWHWYEVRRVGHPHPPTFLPSLRQLERDVDQLLAEHDLDHGQLVIAGFSQGAVMSIAAAFGTGRPRPAGVFAWSGFVPQAEGWELDPAAAAGVPVLLTHGRNDPVIGVQFGHEARALLEAAGAHVHWQEPLIGHELEPASILRARQLLDERFAA